MSLIDADALKKALNEAWEDNVLSTLGDAVNIITNAPTVEREGWVSVPPTILITIARLLDNEMNQCAEHGANSISMPDDLVELAMWLSSAPKE